MGDPVGGLGKGFQGPGLEPGQGLDHHFRAQGREFVVQGPGRGVGGDRDLAGQQHRTGIHAFVDLHDRDAGDGVAFQDRPLDRGGAAPPGQKRRMDVEAAQPGRVEYRLRQPQPIGDDDGAVGTPGLE